MIRKGSLRSIGTLASSMNGNKVRRILHYPYPALINLLEILYPSGDFWEKRFVSRLTNKTSQEIETIFLQAADSLRRFEENVWLGHRQLYRGEIKQGRLLYFLCRLLRPKVVVETGVASGLSSCYILRSLQESRMGRLVSIDLPNFERVLEETTEGYRAVALLPEGEQPGWLVPASLKERWQLIIGKTQEVLEKVLHDCGEIDLFLHDSEHTYECMMFEYTTAWEHLRPGGLLLSDDVGWNEAFFEFAQTVGRSPEVVARNFGGISN